MPAKSIEDRRRYCREYYKRNKRRLNMLHIKYNREHKEELKQYHIEYAKINKDKIFEYQTRFETRYMFFRYALRHDPKKIKLSLESFTKLVQAPCAFCGSDNKAKYSKGFVRVNRKKSYHWYNCLPACPNCIRYIDHTDLKFLINPPKYKRCWRRMLIREAILDNAMEGRIRI